MIDQNLRATIASCGITNNKFAKEFQASISGNKKIYGRWINNVSVGTVYNWLNGNSVPHKSYLSALCVFVYYAKCRGDERLESIDHKIVSHIRRSIMEMEPDEFVNTYLFTAVERAAVKRYFIYGLASVGASRIIDDKFGKSVGVFGHFSVDPNDNVIDDGLCYRTFGPPVAFRFRGEWTANKLAVNKSGLICEFYMHERQYHDASDRGGFKGYFSLEQRAEKPMLGAYVLSGFFYDLVGWRAEFGGGMSAEEVDRQQWVSFRRQMNELALSLIAKARLAAGHLHSRKQMP